MERKQTPTQNRTKPLVYGTVLSAFLLGVSGCDSDQAKQTTFTQSTVPIGVSDSLNQEALDRFGLDLSENLDPKIVPALMTDAVKETVEANVSEQDFLATLVSKISNKIRDISTIDLNGDGLADPVLVVPQVNDSGQDFLTFSILVPDPAEVKELPPGSDQDAWRDIAENKSVEVMTTSVIREGEDQVTVQSAPNPQMYQGPGYSPYYSATPSFGSMFLASMAGSMMANWLFSPSYGYGYGGYNPGPSRQVTTVQSNRSAYTSSLNNARPTSSAARTAGGQTVAANKFRPTSTSSLNQMKSTQFRAQSGSARSGGFGRSNSAVSRPAPASAPKPAVRSAPTRKSFSAPTKRSFGGFGRRKR